MDAGGDGIAAQCHFLEVEDAATERSDMRLALMTPALEEETVTSWSFTLSERLEELFSSMVPPRGGRP